MIIVEGMDNTGKSTLIQTLIRETSGRGYLNAKVSLGPNKPEHEQKDWLWSQTYLNIPTVYDRFLPICDRVYGEVLRGGTIWNDRFNMSLTDLFRKQQSPLIIYCRPPKDIIMGFKDGRDQMPGVIENAEALINRYDKIMEELIIKNWHTVKYDYTIEGDLDRIKNIVEAHLRDMNIVWTN